MVRKGEKTLGKLARWQNHKHFNIRCRYNNITPNSLKLRTCMKGVKTMKIIHNAEKKLLQERIRQCNFTIRKYEESVKELKSSLQSKVSTEINNQILTLFEKTHSSHFEMAKSRQRQKFDRLLISKKEIWSPTTNIGDTNIDRTKRVMNLSDRPLSDSER